MRLYIHGIGALTLGVDEPFVEGVGRLENIPINEYARPAFRRRFARLSKLTYVAASKAMADARVEDPEKLAIITSSALGETTVSLDLLAQIQKSMGRTLRPWLVPNSVHNAPAGYLSIGHKNRQPSVTASQGWLSSEAGIVAAEDILATDQAERALIISGDEADPNWVERLEEAGASKWADMLNKEAFQEGVTALVVGKEPGGRELGSLTAGVERAAKGPDALIEMLKRYGITPGPNTEIRVRLSAAGEELKNSVERTFEGISEKIHFDGPGPGSVQAGALAALNACISKGSSNELLLFGREIDEIAFVHWVQ
ncbi:MAG: hypothetical protein GY847_21215 [Proteobacteria bacterium]|nr:hypothetical protein [Pseudomonadota bacterium]